MPANSASRRLTHSVFFTLTQSSPEKCEQLVADCHHYLTQPPGVVTLQAGVRDTDLSREVNDTQFHVALIVVFENRAAHDAYQDHPAHLEFAQRNRPNFSTVRIFDAVTH